MKKLEPMFGQWKEGIIGCRDFNSYSTLWGQKNNVNILEDVFYEQELVCLNDGTDTRLNIAQGSE